MNTNNAQNEDITDIIINQNDDRYQAFFLETNAIPLQFTLIGRRLMYYWTLINKSDNELVKQIFETQKLYRCKDDWINVIEENLIFCEIYQTYCIINSF